MDSDSAKPCTASRNEKFESLFHHYKNLMMHIARGVTQNEEQAEEAVQDSLLKMLMHIEQIGAVRSPATKGWVILITKRTAADKLRYESRRVHEGGSVMGDVPEERSLETTAMVNIAFEQVRSGLKKMSGRDYELIMLRYYCGYSDARLAKHFSISPDLVRKRCERARKRLLSKLGPID